MTNADIIRNMTDEELITLFHMIDPTKAISEKCSMLPVHAIKSNRNWLANDVEDSKEYWNLFYKKFDIIYDKLYRG